MILDASQNHLKIEHMSDLTFHMWHRLRYCYTDSEEVTVNFAYLLSKLRRVKAEQRNLMVEWLEEQASEGGNQMLIEVAMIVRQGLSSGK